LCTYKQRVCIGNNLPSLRPLSADIILGETTNKLERKMAGIYILDGKFPLRPWGKEKYQPMSFGRKIQKVEEKK
jgi:hypothetical protein